GDHELDEVARIMPAALSIDKRARVGPVRDLSIHTGRTRPRRQVTLAPGIFVVRATTLAQIKIQDRFFRALIHTRGDLKGDRLAPVGKVDLIIPRSRRLERAEIEFINIVEGRISAAGSGKSRWAEHGGPCSRIDDGKGKPRYVAGIGAKSHCDLGIRGDITDLVHPHPITG